MAQTFTITTTATDVLKTDDKGHAEAVFTVTNTTARPVRGMASARALESTQQEWLQIRGETERDFSPGRTQQFVVTFDAPVATAPSGGQKSGGTQTPGSGTPTGAAAADKYSFRFYVASAMNPDEDFTESPVVKVELPAAKPVPPPPPPRKWWLIILIAAVVVIGIGIGIFFLIPDKNVAVPNVIGMTLDEANTALLDAKLTPVEKEVQITEKAPPGQVIDQDPKSDSPPVPKGTEVALITEGEVPLVEVPDVTKRLFSDAKQRLTEKGLSVVETSTEVTEGLQPNQVVSQDPAAGTQVKPASTVKLVVAVQRQISVPDVTFKPEPMAKQTITAAGLTVVMKDPELANVSAAPGNIIRQNPVGGSKVPPGAAIELVAAAQPTTVPNVVGKKVAAAQILLQQAGLELGRVSGLFNVDNADLVVIKSQSPVGNTTVAKGSKVGVSVPQPCPRGQRCVSVTITDRNELKRISPVLRFKQ
jgi:beta-lactam-binding protein with PASTA domain